MDPLRVCEILKELKLTDEDCDKVVTDAHLELISRCCCEQWKSLPSHLGLDTIIANDIDKLQKDEEEKRLKFFTKWKKIRGSAATYRRLIAALLEIKCTQDAERICKILKESVFTGSGISPNQPDTASTTALDQNTLDDLKLQLDAGLKKIIHLYSNYVSHIRKCLKEKGIGASDLSSDLMTESAFYHAKQERALLSAHEAELENAADINKIFNILTKQYASFLNYEIFEIIAKKYGIDHGQEEMKYPQHLIDYLERHKVSEFIEINPLLRKYSTTSTELVLKLDIKSTVRLAKLEMIKAAIANILDLKSAALQLLDIQRGCLVVTFLIPTPVAKLLFNDDTVLTEEQEAVLPALSVLWLECNNRRFDFIDKRVQEAEERVTSRVREAERRAIEAEGRVREAVRRAIEAEGKVEEAESGRRATESELRALEVEFEAMGVKRRSKDVRVREAGIIARGTEVEAHMAAYKVIYKAAHEAAYEAAYRVVCRDDGTAKDAEAIAMEAANKEAHKTAHRETYYRHFTRHKKVPEAARKAAHEAAVEAAHEAGWEARKTARKAGWDAYLADYDEAGHVVSKIHETQNS